MSKGFKVTLMMVAIALIGYHAMATAPVISELPSPIVADDAPVSGGNHFVYPDAIDLDSKVTDDGPIANVVWSFLESSGTYSINGAATIALPADDPTSPGAKAISSAMQNSEENPDGKVKTITIRNIKTSPFSGSASVTLTTPGIAADQTKVVTLFASDGTTFSQKNMMVYTDKNGTDRFSGSTPSTQVAHIDLTTGTGGFATADVIGSVTASSTGGICFEVAATGNNIASWKGQYGLIPLVDNAVWRIRLKMSSTQTTAFKNPLWDVVVDNFGIPQGGSTNVGQNAYGGDYLFLDNEGGANAPGTLGRTDFQVWFTPVPVQTAQWKSTSTGAFKPAFDTDNDMRVIFRVLDVDDAGINAQNDLGKICLQELTIDRFSISDLPADGAPVFNQTSIQDAAGANDGTKFTGAQLVGSTMTFTGGVFKAVPSASAGWGNEIVSLNPGNVAAASDVATGTNISDNWPIAWESDKLYKVEVGFSAPDATGESNPADVLRFGMDAPTQELLALCFVTPNMGLAGMPKQGAAQTYTMFFYSHTASKTSIASLKALRPRIDVLCADALQAGGFTTNKGGFQVHSVVVTKVKVQ